MNNKTWIAKDHPFKEHLIVLKDDYRYYTFEYGWLNQTWYLHSYEYYFDGTLASNIRKEAKLVNS